MVPLPRKKMVQWFIADSVSVSSDHTHNRAQSLLCFCIGWLACMRQDPEIIILHRVFYSDSTKMPAKKEKGCKGRGRTVLHHMNQHNQRADRHKTALRKHHAAECSGTDLVSGAGKLLHEIKQLSVKPDPYTKDDWSMIAPLFGVKRYTHLMKQNFSDEASFNPRRYVLGSKVDAMFSHGCWYTNEIAHPPLAD